MSVWGQAVEGSNPSSPTRFNPVDHIASTRPTAGPGVHRPRASRRSHAPRTWPAERVPEERSRAAVRARSFRQMCSSSLHIRRNDAPRTDARRSVEALARRAYMCVVENVNGAPTLARRYEGTVYDSSRWDGFELRPGDIIISTAPKCGTTWTQMICALLVLQEPELPLPLDTLSPWIDMVTRARTEVFADLAAQTHRRFIKTHTPLDGIPNDPTVTYICVGRDPRDVALSMDHHIDNMDIGAFLEARERAAAIDGIELGPLHPPPPRPDGERDRFWQWVDDETPSTQVRVVAAAHRRAPADVPGRRRRSRRRVPALRRPEGGPGGADAGAGRTPRHRGRRGPVAAPGPGGDVRVDAQQGRHDRPRRWSGALDRPRRVLQPRDERPVGATSSTTPTSPGTPRGCGRSRPTTSSSGCTASRSTESPFGRLSSVAATPDLTHRASRDRAERYRPGGNELDLPQWPPGPAD